MMKPRRLAGPLGETYQTISARMTDLDVIGEILQPIDAGADWCASNRNYVWYYSLGLTFAHAAYIAEIGVRFGYSLYALMSGIRSVSDHALRVFGFDNESYVQNSNAIALQNLTRISNATVTVQTVDSVRDGITVPESIDIFSIDGDHTYAGTCRDLETALPLLAKEGILVVDDITGIPESPEIDRACRDFAAGNGLASILVPTYRGMYILFRWRFADRMGTMIDRLFSGRRSDTHTG